MRVTVLLLAALIVTSCASIAHGPNESIAIESSPSGAEVMLRCASLTRSGVTPVALTIPRRVDECGLTVSKKGFKSRNVPLERGFAKQYWINFIGIGILPFGIADNSPISFSQETGLALFLAGGVGAAVDRIDGAMYEHHPATIRVTLEPE